MFKYIIKRFNEYIIHNNKGILEFMGIPDSLLIPILTTAAQSFMPRGGDKVKQEAMLTADQKQILSFLKEKGISEPEIYGGKLGEFEMAPMEKEAQEGIRGLMGEALPRTMELGAGEIEKVLTGGYDPYTSEFYKSMTRGIERGAVEEADVLARRSSMMGRLSSGARERQLGLLGERTAEQKTGLLAGLYEQERGRRLTAAGMGTQMGMAGEQVRMGRLGAGMEAGGLQRMLEDARAKASYGEWTRAKGERLSQLQTALGAPTQYGVKEMPVVSPWEQFTSEALGRIGGYYGMGGAGAGGGDTAARSSLYQSSRYPMSMEQYKYPYSRFAD